jgi:hypothetical protein
LTSKGTFVDPVRLADQNSDSGMAMEDREFGNLIGSDKVEGTAVYGAERQKMGTINGL